MKKVNGGGYDFNRNSPYNEQNSETSSYEQIVPRPGESILDALSRVTEANRRIRPTIPIEANVDYFSAANPHSERLIFHNPHEGLSRYADVDNTWEHQSSRAPRQSPSHLDRDSPQQLEERRTATHSLGVFPHAQDVTERRRRAEQDRLSLEKKNIKDRLPKKKHPPCHGKESPAVDATQESETKPDTQNAARKPKPYMQPVFINNEHGPFENIDEFILPKTWLRLKKHFSASNTPAGSSRSRGHHVSKFRGVAQLRSLAKMRYTNGTLCFDPFDALRNARTWEEIYDAVVHEYFAPTTTQDERQALWKHIKKASKKLLRSESAQARLFATFFSHPQATPESVRPFFDATMRIMGRVGSDKYHLYKLMSRNFRCVPQDQQRTFFDSLRTLTRLVGYHERADYNVIFLRQLGQVPAFRRQTIINEARALLRHVPVNMQATLSDALIESLQYMPENQRVAVVRGVIALHAPPRFDAIRDVGMLGSDARASAYLGLMRNLDEVPEALREEVVVETLRLADLLDADRASVPTANLLYEAVITALPDVPPHQLLGLLRAMPRYRPSPDNEVLLREFADLLPYTALSEVGGITREIILQSRMLGEHERHRTLHHLVDTAELLLSEEVDESDAKVFGAVRDAANEELRELRKAEARKSKDR